MPLRQNVQEIQTYLEQAFQKRDKLKILSIRTGAEDDMLRLLERSIPVLEGDFDSRLGKIALQADGGSELDPIPWTSPDGWIRCPEWDQAQNAKSTLRN